MSGFHFEWDNAKAASNRRKHGVTFEEAETVFEDPYVLLREDTKHSDEEDRLQAIGLSDRFRVLFVVFVEVHEDVLRIVMARKATRAERNAYEERKADAQER